MLSSLLVTGCGKSSGTTDTNTNTDTTNTGTDTITPEPTKSEILSFDVNESYKDYKSIQLDDVDNIKAKGGDSSVYKRTSFFKNSEGGKDTYKVGDANAFKLECKGSYLDSTGTLVNASITDIDHKLEIRRDTGEYVDVTSEESTYVEVLGLDFDFKESAVGHQFKLTVSPDDAKYTGNFQDVLEFEVIDGWNVYTPNDLAYLDNYDVNSDKISAEDREIQGDHIRDVWADKRSIDVAKDIHGIVLQKDISLTSADLPELLVWSEEEVEAYRANNSEDFTTWAKNLFKTADDGSSRTDEECYALAKAKMVGSLKDYINIFSRITDEDETFRIEGNYFNLDVSGIKKIVKFRDKTLVKANASNGSHSQLLGFPGDGGIGINYSDCFVPFQFRSQDGEIIMNNFNVKGNGTRDNSSENLGGLIAIKSTSLDLKATNVNSSDTFITFFSRPADDDLTQSHTKIDRSRWYDSYSSMLYFHSTIDNQISNSIMIGAGGALMLMSESGAHNKTNHNGASADVTNSYLESYCNGTESWFVDKNASAYVPMLALYQNGILNTLKGQYDTSSNYVKVQNGVSYVNMIAISVDGDDPFGNPIAAGDALTGHFTIDGQSILDYSDITSTTGALYPLAATMSAMGQQGMLFKSSAGGMAAAGDTKGNEMLAYSRTFAALPSANKNALVNAFAAQNAQLGQLASANLFPASYTKNMISPALRSNGVTPVAEELDNNLTALTSGDYMAISLQADPRLQYIGVVLGYNA